MSSEPQYAVPDENLVALTDYPKHQMTVPPSKMFIIKEALKTYRQKTNDPDTYDASQGDGGASLNGVPEDILRQAFEMQVEHGTGYDKPYGYDGFRESVANSYWQFKAETGYGPANVCAGMGGRDILTKAFQAMIYMGRGFKGDVLLTSAVPWISYNWGPYAVGLNVLRAPGDPNEAWSYTEEGIEEAVSFAQKSGRSIAGMIITSPDNPTGRTISIEQQVKLGQKALEQGVQFVLYDWIYHYITEGEPNDINKVLNAFSPEDRKRLMFLDGLTKSMGGSNVRNAHLVASEEVTKFIVSRASHGVFPSFYSQAVAVAAYEMGFAKAAADTIQTTNASRNVLGGLLQENGYNHVIGDGYYAFVDVSASCAEGKDSRDVGTVLAEDFGVAVVPGAFFSDAGKYWIRFSYATPPERTAKAFERLHKGLESLKNG